MAASTGMLGLLAHLRHARDGVRDARVAALDEYLVDEAGAVRIAEEAEARRHVGVQREVGNERGTDVHRVVAR
jgi:hypothetical protein